MIVHVEPPLSPDFAIPANADSVQFSKILTDSEYQRLAQALEGRANVRLRIYNDHAITDLQFLRFFPFIRRLSIELWSLSSLEGIYHIRDLDELTLGQTKTRALSLDFLRHYPSLRHLYLEGHTKGIEHLDALTRLERLTLRSITLPDVALLGVLPRLRHLEIKLGGTKHLADLARLTQLESLDLWSIRGLSELSFLPQLAALESLFLQTLNKVTELPSFRSLGKLRIVHLETMKALTDISPIADAPALESLRLVDMSRLQVETLKRFASHPTLRHFNGGLGSLSRNAQAERLVGLPQSAFY